MTVPGNLVAGRYRLLGLLGEGGMGAAWRARDERLWREVAVKQLKVSPDIGAEAVAQMVRRMQREAQAAPAPMADAGSVQDIIHDLLSENPSHRPTAAQAAKRLRQEPTAVTIPDPGDRTPVRLWEVGNRSQIGQLTGRGWVSAVAFSPDGTTLASGHGDGTVRLWTP